MRVEISHGEQTRVIQRAMAGAAIFACSDAALLLGFVARIERGLGNTDVSQAALSAGGAIALMAGVMVHDSLRPRRRPHGNGTG